MADNFGRPEVSPGSMLSASVLDAAGGNIFQSLGNDLNSIANRNETARRQALLEARQKEADARTKLLQDRVDAKYNAEQAMLKANAAGPQKVFADLNASDPTNNSDPLQAKYNDMSLTAPEVEATKGLDISNTKALTGALKSNPQMLASVLKKAKAQQELSDIASNQGRKETRYEQQARNIKELQAAGFTPTADMYKRADDLLAADIQSRATKQKGLQAQISALEKVQLKARQEKAKAQDKGSGYGTKGRSKTYTGSEVPFKEAIANIKSYVSPKGVGIDAARVDDWVDKFDKQGYSPDKQRYILDNMKEYGFFGNNISSTSDDKGKKEAGKFATQYDSKYGKKGGYGNSKVVDLSNETIAQTDNQLKELRKRMTTLGTTPEEAQRASNTEKILDIDTNVPKVEKFTSGKKGPDADVKIDGTNDAFLNDYISRHQKAGSNSNGVKSPSSLDKQKRLKINTEFNLLLDKSMHGGLNKSESARKKQLQQMLGIKSVLGGYTQAPGAPTVNVKKAKVLTAEEKRRQNGLIPKLLNAVPEYTGLTNEVQSIGNDLLEGASAAVGGANRAAEFFTNPFIDGYNYLTGNNIQNPFTAASNASETLAKNALARRGVNNKEDVNNAIMLQELMTPIAPKVKAPELSPEVVDIYSKALQRNVLPKVEPVQGPVNWISSKMTGKITPDGGFGNGIRPTVRPDLNPKTVNEYAQEFLNKRMAETGSKGIPKPVVTPTVEEPVSLLGYTPKPVPKYPVVKSNSILPEVAGDVQPVSGGSIQAVKYDQVIKPVVNKAVGKLSNGEAITIDELSNLENITSKASGEVKQGIQQIIDLNKPLLNKSIKTYVAGIRQGVKKGNKLSSKVLDSLIKARNSRYIDPSTKRIITRIVNQSNKL